MTDLATVDRPASLAVLDRGALPVAARAQKACTTCGQIKPLDAFHREVRSSDGHRGQCADCSCARQMAYKVQNADLVRARERSRYREDPQRFRERSRVNRANGKGMPAEYFREYLKAHPGKRRAYIQTWNSANGEKRRAHSAFWRALRSGSIVRPETCVACGAAGRIEAHHDDYAKPLSVRWLCKKCHHRADLQRKAVA